MVRMALLHLMAQVRQFLYQHGLHQRQQGAHLGIGQVIVVLRLVLRHVVEQQSLVNLIVAALQITL